MKSGFLILILTLLFFGIQITDRPFFTKGEAREAVVVQGMKFQNNYILPNRNGEEIPSKPPMYHWTAALATEIFGLTEFAIRLPSVIYASLCVILTLSIVSSSANSITAILILISAVEFNRSATSARVDMCFCFFLTLACFSAFHILNKKDFFYNFIFLTIGLIGSILSKGPAGLAFPVTIAGIYSLIINRNNLKKIFIDKSFYLLTLSTIFSIAIAAIWYFLAYQIGKDEFLVVHLARENVGRFVNNNTNPGHEKPFYFSIIYLILGFLPWSLLLPISFKQLWSERKNLLNEENQLKLYSLIWFFVYFVVVTITQSKRSVYLLPAYPALAILISHTRVESLQSEKINKLCFWILSIVSGIILLITLGYETIKEPLTNLGIRAKHISASDLFFENIPSFKLYLIILLLISILLLGLNKKLSFFKKLLITVCTFSVITNAIALPTISQNFSPKNFLNLFGENSKLSFFKESYYSFCFYYGHDIPVVYKKHTDADYIIVSEEKLEEFKAIYPDKKIVLESDTPIIHGRYKAIAFTEK